ncbi:MAG TPA: hypothetical protein VNO32_18730 [Candidatus Acidoferrum sp.]|jgi:hypothetical protein|nr:hypothetical protein [Candidatus Acidoferrum sp.]
MWIQVPGYATRQDAVRAYRDLIEITPLTGGRTNTSSNSTNHELPPAQKRIPTARIDALAILERENTPY